MSASRRALFIGYVWPEPESSAAGVRTLALVEHFRRAGYEIHCASGAKTNLFSERLGQAGAQLHEVRANDSTFDTWVAQLAPEVVIFDRFVIEEQFGWRVEEFSPRSLRVIDLQDLHFLRRAREAAFRAGASLEAVSANRIELDTDDTLREVAAIHRADLSLVISPFETELLREKFGVPEERLLTLGFSVKDAEDVPVAADSRRANFAMLGNFRHPPNRDSFDWVRTEIWPLIRKRLPDAELHVYGSYPPKDAMAFDDPRTGFRVKGQCADARATLAEYKVALAPLRFGAGLKGKILDAWRAGTPVVTTPIGAEGMEFAAAREGTTDPSQASARAFAGKVARTTDEVAQLACDLYLDPLEQKRLRALGTRALQELYGWEANQNRLFAAIEGALDDLDARRRRNFVGRMLTHHQMKSLKYFSRWIEEKEKRSPSSR